MTRSALLVPVTLAAASLALAGCGRRTEVNVNVDTTATGAAPAPASPSAPADTFPGGGGLATTPIPDTAWVASPEGMGPVRVGMGEAVAVEALGMKMSDLQRMDGSTCTYVTPKALRPGVAVMLNEGRVARIDVDPYIGMGEGQRVESARLPRTDRGIGVGSTLADVQRAYGAGLRTEPHHYVEGTYVYLPVADTARQAFVLETDGRVVTSIRAGRRPEAEWIEGCS